MIYLQYLRQYLNHSGPLVPRPVQHLPVEVRGGADRRGRQHLLHPPRPHRLHSLRSLHQHQEVLLAGDEGSDQEGGREQKEVNCWIYIQSNEQHFKRVNSFNKSHFAINLLIMQRSAASIAIHETFRLMPYKRSSSMWRSRCKGSTAGRRWC